MDRRKAVATPPRTMPGSDAVFTSWLLAWDAHALLTPGLSLWDAPILFPAANTFALSENMLGNVPVSLPAYVLTDNATFAANCLVIFAFVFSAVAVFLLVRRLTGSFLAGLVSGILFSFNPYRWEHACHLQLLPFYWSVFALFFAHAYLTSQQTRHWIGMLVMIAGQFYACIYNGIMLLVFLPTLFVIYLLSQRLRRRPDDDGFLHLGRLAKLLVLSAGPLIAVLWPLAGPYFKASADWNLVRTLAENEVFSASASGFLSPARSFANYAFLRSWLPEPQTLEGAVFLGLTPWLLAFCGIFFLSRRGPVAFKIGRTHVLLAIVVLVLMLGPYLHLDSDWLHSGDPAAVTATGEKGDIRVALPFRYLYALFPGAKALRVPARFAQFLLLSLTVLAGFGIAGLEQRLRAGPRYKGWVVGSAFLLLLLYDYQTGPGFATRLAPPGQFPAVYRYLQQSPERVLLELPFGAGGRPDTWHSYRYLHYQTGHWRRKVDGVTSFLPEGLELLSQRTGRAPNEEGLQLIAATPAETVVIHLNYYLTKDRAAWESVSLEPFGFTFAGRFEDAMVWERTGPSAPAPDFALSKAFVLGQGPERGLLLAGRREGAGAWLFLGEPMAEVAVTGSDKAGRTVHGSSRTRVPAHVPSTSTAHMLFAAKLPPGVETIRRITFEHRLLGVRQMDGSDVVVLPVEKTSASDGRELAARIDVDGPEPADSSWVAGRDQPVAWRISNVGKAAWLPASLREIPPCLDQHGVVYLAVSWYPESGIPKGAPESGFVKRQAVPISELVVSGEETTVRTRVEAPTEPGRYLLCVEMLSQCVTWFSAVARDQTVIRPVEVLANEMVGPKNHPMDPGKRPEDEK